MLSENEPFDKPLPDTLIINNGVYHIESGKFIAGFDPDLHARSRHNIDYNPHAKCPAFIEMMTKLFGKDNLEFIFAWFGYCLYRAYPIQQFLIIEGRGGKGKSTLLNILRDFVGKENTSALKLPVLVNSDDRFSKVFLVGKTLNIDADAKPAHLGDGSELKGLTGEDMVSVEIKGGDMFQYYNYAKLTFAMNFLPPYMDDSGGTERRALILPATGETFSIKKYRALLAQIEKEKSGIFIQAMKFLKKTLHDENFPQSQTMLKRADEWKRDNDNVLTFLEEKADTTDPDQHVKSQELYNSFRDYCSDIGSHPVGMKKFVQNLKSKQYEQIRKGDGMYWKGIELKNNPETNWK
jgi:putative DNA primase/helicase